MSVHLVQWLGQVRPQNGGLPFGLEGKNWGLLPFCLDPLPLKPLPPPFSSKTFFVLTSGVP